MNSDCPELEERIALALQPADNWRPADLSLSSHVFGCNSCLAEHQRLLGDRFTAAELATFPALEAQPALSVGQRIALLDYPLLVERRIAFRGDQAAVLYSGLIPLPESYVLLELAQISEVLTLRLEAGRKNGTPVEISLYNGDDLVEKSRLRQRLEWRLDGLTPGQYRIAFNESKILGFRVQG
ncbi:MAG: UDP-glycosyltransferase family protein [Leptospirales bacterium]|nr:UDP-glycosyltransferase family protein [Leptospirales bacterium]